MTVLHYRQPLQLPKKSLLLCHGRNHEGNACFSIRDALNDAVHLDIDADSGPDILLDITRTPLPAFTDSYLEFFDMILGMNCPAKVYITRNCPRISFWQRIQDMLAPGGIFFAVMPIRVLEIYGLPRIAQPFKLPASLRHCKNYRDELVKDILASCPRLRPVRSNPAWLKVPRLTDISVAFIKKKRRTRFRNESTPVYAMCMAPIQHKKKRTNSNHPSIMQ